VGAFRCILVESHPLIMKLFVCVTVLALASLASSVSAFQSPAISLAPARPSLSVLQMQLAEGDDRRAFIIKAAAFASAVSGVPSSPFLKPVFAADGVSYKDVAADIAALVKANPDYGPTMVRLAWHSSGTYDKISKTGGSGGGTIRFKEELAHGGNAGLGETAVKWLEPIKDKYGDALSYADLYTLAGVASIKAMGGPTIQWCAGRTDQPVAAVTPDGRLPNADVGPAGTDPSDAQHLRDVFYRMGFNDQEIVALSGAHALGRCHTTASGYDGPWTPTPTTFNNAYFTLLKNLDWTKRDWSGPFQYEDGGKTLMMLPTDLVLLKDKKFLKYVDLYAKDARQFDRDFAAAFHKLLELGTSGLAPTEWA